MLGLDTLRVTIRTRRGIIRAIKDHLLSTGLERVVLTASTLPFQPSQGSMAIRKDHQEQHHLELAHLVRVLVAALPLRAPCLRRAIQAVQVQVGHDQGQGLSVRVATPSTLRAVDLA